MELSLEAYLAVNFSVTAALLALSVGLVGPVQPVRVAVSALVSACASAAIHGAGLPDPFAGALVPFSVFCALGWSRRGEWLRCLGWCALLSCAFAGCVLFVQRALPLRSMARSPILAGPFLAAVWRVRKNGPLPESRLRMRVDTAMGTAEFTALIDTGNQLREPISARPVLIVSGACLKGVLESSLLSDDGQERLALGFRVVCYHTLNGSGRMRCFRPASVKRLRRGRWIDAPPVWVGIYCGRLPGGADALAPACCAAETGKTVNEG